MTGLPDKFLNKMQAILGDEYERFLDEFDGGRQFGLRVNTAKITLEEFERIAPFHLTKIPWISNGYFYEEEDMPARHPFYGAGLYYLQEPSAMTPASRLPVNPGDRVLDLCAAPGGKATALGAKLQGRGLLVANDINTARAKALLRNIELFGIPNAFVTNEAPYVLAEKYPEYFDKIMVDAPCSGEGMFRKNPAAAEAWLEKGPEYFSRLQQEIILHGADMLRPGGMMFYSTCTFSPEENEGTISFLLRERPDMEVVPMEDYEGFSPGLTTFGEEKFHESCHLCRRIWPHKMAGEGHFMALLHKKEKEDTEKDGSISGENTKEMVKTKRSGKKRQPVHETEKKPVSWWNGCKGPDKDQKKDLENFFSQVLWEMSAEQVDIRKDKIYFVPDRTQENKRLHFLRNGVYLGDLKKKRFEPSQPFALALSKDTFTRCLHFSAEDQRLQRYLKGESFSVDDLSPQENGWYLVTAAGYPLGFGKVAGNTLKNKYPVGWRKK